MHLPTPTRLAPPLFYAGVGQKFTEIIRKFRKPGGENQATQLGENTDAGPCPSPGPLFFLFAFLNQYFRTTASQVSREKERTRNIGKACRMPGLCPTSPPFHQTHSSPAGGTEPPCFVGEDPEAQRGSSELCLEMHSC